MCLLPASLKVYEPVSGENNLALRALIKCLLGQCSQRPGSTLVSPSQEPADRGRIRDTLNTDVLVTNSGTKGVEERGASQRADVAELAGASGEDDSHWPAQAEFVPLDGEALTRAQLGAEGAHCLEPTCFDIFDWGCDSGGYD